MEDGMPKVTSGGASNAHETPEVAVDEAAVLGFEWGGRDGDDEAVEAATVQEDAETVTAAAVEEELSPADVAAGYTDLSFKALRAEAKNRGLPAGGTATELAARLAEHDQATADQDAEDEDGE
jgi:hypothetical protein